MSNSNSTLITTGESHYIKTSNLLGIIVIVVLLLCAFMIFCHSRYRDKKQVGVTNSNSTVKARQENNKGSLETNEIILSV